VSNNRGDSSIEMPEIVQKNKKNNISIRDENNQLALNSKIKAVSPPKRVMIEPVKSSNVFDDEPEEQDDILELFKQLSGDKFDMKAWKSLVDREKNSNSSENWPLNRAKTTEILPVKNSKSRSQGNQNNMTINLPESYKKGNSNRTRYHRSQSLTRKPNRKKVTFKVKEDDETQNSSFRRGRRKHRSKSKSNKNLLKKRTSRKKESSSVTRKKIESSSSQPRSSSQSRPELENNSTIDHLALDNENAGSIDGDKSENINNTINKETTE